MTLERIRALIDQALRTEDRTGVAWVTGMEMFDGFVRDAERYRTLRKPVANAHNGLVFASIYCHESNTIPYSQPLHGEQLDLHMDAERLTHG